MGSPWLFFLSLEILDQKEITGGAEPIPAADFYTCNNGHVVSDCPYFQAGRLLMSFAKYGTNELAPPQWL
jgi:hypothetical protein